MDRRNFLKTTGGVAIVGVTAVRRLAGASQAVAIIVDPKDPMASAASAAWAVRELQAALSGQGVGTATYAEPVGRTGCGSVHLHCGECSSPRSATAESGEGDDAHLSRSAVSHSGQPEWPVCVACGRE